MPVSRLPAARRGFPLNFPKLGVERSAAGVLGLFRRRRHERTERPAAANERLLIEPEVEERVREGRAVGPRHRNQDWVGIESL